MHAGNDATMASDDAVGAARLAIRDEIVQALGGITERDRFLLRLARRITDEAGSSGSAIYLRATPGSDFVLRASTLPATEPIPPRIGPDRSNVREDIIAFASGDTNLRLDVLTADLVDGGEVIGLLALFSWTEDSFTAHDLNVLHGVAEEIGPSVAVAEHHHLVKQASVTDLATGAYTSWYFAQRFDQELARAQRTQSPVTVVLASVLDFENVQHSLGYSAADGLLRDLATEFSGLLRVFDVVAMRSRSDFAILLPDTGITDAETVVSRAQRRSSRVIERMKDAHPDLLVHVVTGAAAFPDDGDRVATIMLAAEHRLTERETNLRRDSEPA